MRKRPIGQSRRTIEHKDSASLLYETNLLLCVKLQTNGLEKKASYYAYTILSYLSLVTFSYRPRLVLSLTADQCPQRLNWCREWKHGGGQNSIMLSLETNSNSV